MPTAAQVTGLVTRSDEGVQAAVTAGLRVPTWAAAQVKGGGEAGGVAEEDLRPGTINIIVSVPVPLADREQAASSGGCHSSTRPGLRCRGYHAPRLCEPAS